MAKHESDNSGDGADVRKEQSKDFSDLSNMSNGSFSTHNAESKQNADKSFAEMAEKSTRLPDIRTSLPISMKEILHSTPKSSSWSPSLPTIPAGQVQLVHRNEDKTARIEKRRRKRERKSKLFQGQRHHESSRSHDIDGQNDGNVKASWKKKLHKRQNKRIIADGDNNQNNLSMSRDFRLPTLREVPKW